MKWLVAIFGLLLLCACNSVPIEYNKGDVVSSPVRIGGHEILLPSGEWRIVEMNEFKGMDPEVPQTMHWRGYYLVQTEPLTGRLVAGAYVRGLISTTGTTGSVDNLCDLTKYFYKDKLNDKFRMPECLIVAVAPGYLKVRPSSADGMNERVWQFFQRANIQLPATSLGVFTRIYSPSGFVFVNLWINPELRGFAPDTGTTLTSSDWGPSRLDPARTAYLESIKSWALKNVPAHRASARKEKQSESANALPPIP